jgi:hypothetical protein
VLSPRPCCPETRSKKTLKSSYGVPPAYLVDELSNLETRKMFERQTGRQRAEKDDGRDTSTAHL